MPLIPHKSDWDNLLSCFGLKRGPAQGRRSPRDTGPRAPKKLARFRRWCQKKFGRNPPSSTSTTPGLPEIKTSHVGEDLVLESVSSEDLPDCDSAPKISGGTYTVNVSPSPGGSTSPDDSIYPLEDFYVGTAIKDIDLFFARASCPDLLDNKNYKFLGELGSGCFGSVFLASELSSGNLVAIKYFKRLANQMFTQVAREAQLHQGISEAVPGTKIVPRFVGLLHVRVDQRPERCNETALVTDFIGDMNQRVSITLAEEIMRVPPLPEPESLCEWAWVMFQVARKMERLHSLGVIHNDLKEDNILLSGRIGTYPCPYISDLGSASYTSDPEGGFKQRVPDPSERLARMTKCPHSAPEIYWNITASTKSDVYSLGVILQRSGLGEVMGIQEFVTRCCSLYTPGRPTMRVAAEVFLSVMTRAQRTVWDK